MRCEFELTREDVADALAAAERGNAPRTLPSGEGRRELKLWAVGGVTLAIVAVIVIALREPRRGRPGAVPEPPHGQRSVSVDATAELLPAMLAPIFLLCLAVAIHPPRPKPDDFAWKAAVRDRQGGWLFLGFAIVVIGSAVGVGVRDSTTQTLYRLPATVSFYAFATPAVVAVAALVWSWHRYRRVQADQTLASPWMQGAFVVDLTGDGFSCSHALAKLQMPWEAFEQVSETALSFVLRETKRSDLRIVPKRGFADADDVNRARALLRAKFEDARLDQIDMPSEVVMGATPVEEPPDAPGDDAKAGPS